MNILEKLFNLNSLQKKLKYNCFYNFWYNKFYVYNFKVHFEQIILFNLSIK